MEQKYAFLHNGFKNTLRAFGWPERGSRWLAPSELRSGKKFVWRNKMTDGYKISNSYRDMPLDLSHYMLLRTRENLLL